MGEPVGVNKATRKRVTSAARKPAARKAGKAKPKVAAKPAQKLRRPAGDGEAPHENSMTALAAEAWRTGVSPGDRDRSRPRTAFRGRTTRFAPAIQTTTVLRTNTSATKRPVVAHRRPTRTRSTRSAERMGFRKRTPEACAPQRKCSRGAIGIASNSSPPDDLAPERRTTSQAASLPHESLPPVRGPATVRRHRSRQRLHPMSDSPDVSAAARFGMRCVRSGRRPRARRGVESRP